MTTITQLARIPELAALAFTGWGAQWRSQEETTHKPVAGPRVPIDLDTFDALRPDAHGLLFELTQAVRATLEEARRGGDYDLEAAEQVTWVGECDWLTRHRAIWEADDYLADYVPDQVRAVYRRLCDVLHEPRAARYLCLECEGLLRPDAGSLACEGCGKLYHAADIAHIVTTREPEKVTLDEAAQRINRPFGTVQGWVRAGKLQPAETGRYGRRYYLADVIKLAIDRGTKAHARSAIQA